MIDSLIKVEYAWLFYMLADLPRLFWRIFRSNIIKTNPFSTQH